MMSSLIGFSSRFFGSYMGNPMSSIGVSSYVFVLVRVCLFVCLAGSYTGNPPSSNGKSSPYTSCLCSSLASSFTSFFFVSSVVVSGCCWASCSACFRSRRRAQKPGRALYVLSVMGSVSRRRRLRFRVVIPLPPPDPPVRGDRPAPLVFPDPPRSEEHTSELQSRGHLVCRLLLETQT